MLNLRVKREFKEVTQNIDGSPTSLDQYRTNVRINYDYYVLRNLRMRSRIEYVFFDQSIVETHEKGYLLFQDFRYDALDQLRFYGRIVLFETDSFNSRVYQFENDVEAYSTIPPYSEKEYAGI